MNYYEKVKTKDKNVPMFHFVEIYKLFELRIIMLKVAIIFSNFILQAELNDSETAQKIYSALPFEGTVNTWGDEVYFDIPVSVGQAADAIEEVEVGTLGYWSVGKAFCLFFGPTPVSSGEKPRAASPVNVFGKAIGDLEPLRHIKSGTPVRVQQAE
jgi:uncharacterized protein